MSFVFCTKCGAKLKENVKFCVICGSSVQNNKDLNSSIQRPESVNQAIAVKKEALSYFSQAQSLLAEDTSKKNYLEIIRLFQQAASNGNAEAELWIDICKLHQFMDILKENSLKRLQRGLRSNVTTSEHLAIQEKERLSGSIENNQESNKNPAEWNLQYDSKSTSPNNSAPTNETFLESAGKVAAGAVVGAAAHQLLQKDQQNIVYAEPVANSSMMAVSINDELSLNDLQFLATVTPAKTDPDEIKNIADVDESSCIDSEDDGGITESIFDFLDNI